MKKIITTLLLLTLTLPLTACQSQQTTEKQTPEIALAKCLTEKGVKFFGGFSCPHCQKQKKLFKEGEKYLPYVECDARSKDADLKQCKENNITAYPTWVFPGQSPILGEVSLEKLAQKSNCKDEYEKAKTSADE